MLQSSLEILKSIESAGYEAYIVGGFVRDHYMNKESFDVDICTSARPKDLIKIFKNTSLPKERYGAVTLFFKGIRFEITTFRKEIKYENRKPIEIEYTSNFAEDIERRDFTINTLCMDYKGNIIDILDGKSDIDNKIIKVVGDTNKKLSEDPLRILRAIRFATQLNFNLDESLKESIKENMCLLNLLSFQRKRDELNKIFASKNIKYGISLLRELDLYKPLNINLDNIILTNDTIGIWAQLNVLELYPFTHLEKEYIEYINEIVKNKVITELELYKYGLYICSIASEILNIDKCLIVKLDSTLKIHTIKDININAKEMCELLSRDAGSWIKTIYDDIETKILIKELENNNLKLKEYIKQNY